MSSATSQSPHHPPEYLDGCIDVHVGDPEWIEGDGGRAYIETLVQEVIAAAFAAAAPPALKARGVEISVSLENDDMVHQLNHQHRGKDKATNVLSFAALSADEFQSGDFGPDGMPVLLGDIILAYDVVRTEARQQGKTFDHHLMHLLVHGLLHLLGHDHENDQDARKMEDLERDVLLALGVDDPYVDDQYTATENGVKL